MNPQNALNTIRKLQQAGFVGFVRLRPRSKKPFGDGWQVADDLSEVSKWFDGTSEFSAPNLGLHAGRNREAFLDFDAQKGAVLDPEEVRQAYGFPVTPCWSTAHGGVQFMFEDVPTGFAVKPLPLLLPGICRIDVKRGNAYSVIPPSSVDGKPYMWVKAPWDTPVAAFPAQWMEPAAPVDGEDSAATVPANVESIAAEALQGLPVYVRDLWTNGRTGRAKRDRSGDGFYLATLCVEHGIVDLTEIAAVVYTSPPHQDKYGPRRGGWDAWTDALSCARRALEKATPPTPQPQGAEAPAFEVLSFEELQPDFREPKFLINPLLPRGEITLLDGDDGIGKTWLCMALTAGLTGSKTCAVPYDHTAKRDCNVLILTCEDDPLVTIGPRLQTLGADLSRVGIVRRRGTQFIDGITAADVAEARPQIVSFKPDLIVVDHITLYAMTLEKLDTSKDTQVSKMLEDLRALARELNCAVLIIRHFRKEGGLSQRPRPGQRRLPDACAFAPCGGV